MICISIAQIWLTENRINCYLKSSRLSLRNSRLQMKMSNMSSSSFWGDRIYGIIMRARPVRITSQAPKPISTTRLSHNVKFSSFSTSPTRWIQQTFSLTLFDSKSHKATKREKLPLHNTFSLDDLWKHPRFSDSLLCMYKTLVNSWSKRP